MKYDELGNIPFRTRKHQIIGKKERTKRMLKRKLPIMLFTTVMLILLAAFMIPYARAETATIWTDKPDYAPGETATIYGTGFLPDNTILIEVTRPDSTVDSWNITSDSSGNFTTAYQLDGITGVYTVVATDGTNTATTTFTDDRVVQFNESGLPSGTTWTVTLDSTPKSNTAPNTIAFPSVTPGLHSYSVTSPLSGGTGVQYVALPLSGSVNVPTGPGGPVRVDITFTTQYQVSFTRSGAGKGTTSPSVTAYYDDGYVIDPLQATPIAGSAFSGWSVSTTTGTITIADTSSASTTATIHGTGTITANFVVSTATITFSQTGVDTDFTGTVLTIDGTINLGVSDLAGGKTFTWTIGSSHTFAYQSPLLVGDWKQYVWASTSGLSTAQSGGITVPAGGGSVTGYYDPYVRVAFHACDVGPDFTGTVFTIDGTLGYKVGEYPVYFMWKVGSSHTFEFHSPLVVNAGRRYVWYESIGIGLPDLQSATITVGPTGGGVTGYYKYQFYLTVTDNIGDLSGVSAQSGWYNESTYVDLTAPPYVDIDPTDGMRYRFDQWDIDVPVHMDSAKTATAIYVKQYYLTLAANPSVTTPTGEGWYDEKTDASISTAEYVYPAIPDGSRHRFNGWTTTDMTEIASASSTSTTVYMDKAKTVTANYVKQYEVKIEWSGLDVDASGKVVTVTVQGVDTVKNAGDSFFDVFVDEGKTVSYAYESLVSSTTNGKRYRFDSASGTSTDQSHNFGAIAGPITETGTYKTQYFLTVTSPYDTPGPIGEDAWYDEGTTAYATLDYGLEDVGGVTVGFVGWKVDGSDWGIWLTSNEITMNAPKTATALWEAAGATYGDVRTVGFWRHQFTVWYRSTLRIKGAGTAQVSVSDLETYLTFIWTNSEYFKTKFGNDGISLMEAYTLLAPLKAHTMKEAAEQQLFAVWLNLANKAFFTYTELSQDTLYVYHNYQFDDWGDQGLQTIAEAIKWSEAELIKSYGNFEAAKTVCDSINNNLGIIWGT